MNNIEELFKDRSQEEISALAYNLGRMLEAAIKHESDNAIDKLTNLEAKVLEFRGCLKEYLILDDYDIFFGIENIKEDTGTHDIVNFEL